MKKVIILCMAMGLLLVGCSQEEVESIERSNGIKTTTNSTSDPKMENINLEDSESLEIFTEAVNDSTKVTGIANMTQPQYRFNVEENYYSLWLTAESGTIMNTAETHTIYSLSKKSVSEINSFLDKNH